MSPSSPSTGATTARSSIGLPFVISPVLPRRLGHRRRPLGRGRTLTTAALPRHSGACGGLRGRAGRVTLALTGAAGIALRVWTYRSASGVPDSDEAVVGLMARHIPPRPVHDILLGPGLRRFAGSAAHRADLRGVRLELARTPSRSDRTLGGHGDPRLACRVAADGRACRLQLQRRSSGSGRRS